MLTDKTKEFLSTQMCIDLQSLDNDLVKMVTNSQKLEVYNYLNNIVQSLANYVHFSLVRDEIIEIAHKAQEQDYNYYLVLDELRHMFDVFTMYPKIKRLRLPWGFNINEGLINIWLHQENAEWYPKILIQTELKPNQINRLDNEVIIYRGCDSREEVDGFGQSWSLDHAVAFKFAFEHYAGESWFTRNSRGLFRAKISKDNIYYYDGDKNSEAEVVVNPLYLYDICKIS